MTNRIAMILVGLVVVCMGLTMPPPLAGHPSYGIAVGADGTVFFTDVLHLGRGTLWALRPNGRLDTLARNFHVHSIALDENGLLYAANGEDEHTLVTFLPGGERDTLIATSNEERFFGGNWAISPSGEIYYGIDNYVWRYTDTTCEKVADLYLERNLSLYVDARGRIYATEIGAHNGDLWRIDPLDSSVSVLASDLITSFPGRKRQPTSDLLMGISGDDYGNMYVAETAGRRIVRVDSNGCISTFYQTGRPWYPTGIAFHNDMAYVLEYSFDSTWHGPRVTRISLDGERSVLLEIGAVAEPPVEEPIRIMPFVAVGVIAIVLVAMWLTFRTRPTDTADANGTAGATGPSNNDDVSDINDQLQ